MAANTKYQQAPTHDPDADEHGLYSQAPPAYQAESSAAQDEARLFGGGAPRASQDEDGDLPRRLQVWAAPSPRPPSTSRMQFIRKVYAILTVQLIGTGAVSVLSFFSEGY
ncbi:uncharacterized protein VDAG_02760, partial [Verticillium dahliae VdLs.17]